MAIEMDDTNNSKAGIHWMQIQVNGLMREFQEKTVTRTTKMLGSQKDGTIEHPIPIQRGQCRVLPTCSISHPPHLNG